MQRLIGVIIGALVTFAFLVIWDATDFIDPVPAYAVAALLGAVGAVVWPVLVGWWFRQRRNSAIAHEVERKAADQDRQG